MLARWPTDLSGGKIYPFDPQEFPGDDERVCKFAMLASNGPPGTSENRLQNHPLKSSEIQAASTIRKLLIRNRDPETVDFLITVRALNGA